MNIKACEDKGGKERAVNKQAGVAEVPN